MDSGEINMVFYQPKLRKFTLSHKVGTTKDNIVQIGFKIKTALYFIP